MAARRMMERRVDGVAIPTFENEDSLMAGFRHQNVPVVAVDMDSPEAMGRTINIDYQHGIRQAVQHLAALGHAGKAFICGPRHLKTAVTRRLAFHECMKEIGLETSQALLVEGDHTLEAGMKGMSVLAALPDRPSVVICSNDLTAIGVMRQASELALGVPRDLSVVGFDDIRMAQFTTPPLTTVQLSQVEIANMAFSALLDSTEPQENRLSRPVYAIQTHLVLRRSTGMAPSRVSKTPLGRYRGRLGGEEAPRRFGRESAFR